MLTRFCVSASASVSHSAKSMGPWKRYTKTQKSQYADGEGQIHTYILIRPHDEKKSHSTLQSRGYEGYTNNIFP